MKKVKRLTAWVVTLAMLLMLVPAAVAFAAEEKVVFMDDFEAYTADASIQTGTAAEMWNAKVESATATAQVIKDTKTQVLCFSNSADKRGGPRVEKNFYLGGVDEITFSYRVRTESDDRAIFSLIANGTTVVEVKDMYTEWTSISVHLDIKNSTYTVSKNGVAEAPVKYSACVTEGLNMRVSASVKDGNRICYDDFVIRAVTDLEPEKLFDKTNTAASSVTYDPNDFPHKADAAGYKKAADYKSKVSDYQTTLFETDFEADSIGAWPLIMANTVGAWSTRVTSTTASIAVQNVDGSQVVRYNNIATKEGGPLLTKKIYNSGMTKLGISFIARSEGCNIAMSVQNAASQNLCSLNQGFDTWTAVDVLLDFEKKTFDIQANGASIKSGALLAEVDGEFTVRINTAHINNNENVYYDNIRIATPDAVDVQIANVGIPEAQRTNAEYAEFVGKAYDGSAPQANVVLGGAKQLFHYYSNYGGQRIATDSEASWQKVTGSLLAFTVGGNDVIAAVNGSMAKKNSTLQKTVSLGLDAADLTVEYNVYFVGNGAVELRANDATDSASLLPGKAYTNVDLKAGWNNFRYEIDYKNAKYSVYVNGAKAESDVAFAAKSADYSSANLYFDLTANTANDAVLIDNISISTKTPIRFEGQFYGIEGVNWDAIKGSAITGNSFVSNLRAHPRIYITDWDDARNKIANDYNYQVIYEKQKQLADALLNESVTSYVFKNERNWLWGARQVEERVSVLAFVYGISGDARYKDRAMEEIRAAGSYPDWSPSAPMIAAECMGGIAIAYDWMYHGLSASEKQEIITILKEKALWQYARSYEGVTSVEIALGVTNRTLLANACGLMCAAAIADEEPVLANYLYENALEYAMKCFTEYGEDGGFPEGTRYWELATDYATKFIGVLLSAPKEGAVLDAQAQKYLQLPNMRETGKYYMYLNSYNKKFSFGDAEDGFIYPSASMYLLAQYANEPMYQWYMDYIMEQKNKTDLGYMRFAWYDDSIKTDVSDIPKDIVFDSATSSVATTRSSFTDKNMLFAALQGGTNTTGHMYYSLGNFAIDANGQRFIQTAGPADYNYQYAPEQYYIKRAEGQNTLVFNPDLTAGQNNTGHARFVDSAQDADEFYAVLDMTSAYANAEYVKRGMLMTKGRQSVVIQDEFKMTKPSEVYWFARTPADIVLAADGRSALLTIGTERMLVVLSQAPAGAKLSIMETKPLPTSPTAKDEAYTDGFKLAVHATNVTEGAIRVEFIPLDAGEAPELMRLTPYLPMAQWVLSPDTAEKSVGDVLADSVALKLGSPVAFANGGRTYVDTTNYDISAFTENGRTLVPVRFISESFGARVGWEDATQTVTIVSGINTIKLQIGSNVMTVNGKETYLDVPAQTVGGRTMIPLRALVETLGKSVFWDDRGVIIINNHMPQLEETQIQRVIDYLETRVQIGGAEMTSFDLDKTVYTMLPVGDNSITVCNRGAAVPVENGRFTVAGKTYAIEFANDSFAGLSGTNTPDIISRVNAVAKAAGAVETVPNYIPVKQVTMSTGHDKYLPSGTIDNLINEEIINRWSGNGSGAYLTYDFGEVKNLHSFGIATLKGNERCFLFKMEISNDGVNWTEVLNTQTSGTTTLFDIDDIGASARFVRLTGYGDGDGGTYNSWTEVRFWESAAQQAADRAEWSVTKLAGAESYAVGTTLQMQTEAYNALGESMPYSTVTYTTSDAKIATVDANGKITVVGAGTAVITATVHNGYKNVSGMAVLNCK